MAGWRWCTMIFHPHWSSASPAEMWPPKTLQLSFCHSFPHHSTRTWHGYFLLRCQSFTTHNSFHPSGSCLGGFWGNADNLPGWQQQEPLLTQGEWGQKVTVDSLSAWHGKAGDSWHRVLSHSTAARKGGETGQAWGKRSEARENQQDVLRAVRLFPNWILTESLVLI